MKKIIALAFLCIITATSVHAQNAESIAKKYVEAIGGAAKWKAITSMKMTMTLNQQGFDIPGTLHRDNKNRTKFQIEFQGMKMIQAYDGTTAWGINPFQGETQIKELQGEAAAQMKEDQFLDDFIVYANNGSSIEYLGTEEIEGQSVEVIKLTKASGTTTTHYFDKESGLKVADKQTAQGNEILTVYSEYTEVEGVMVSLKRTQKMGGAVLLTLTFKDVVFNEAFSDDLFAMPK